MIRARLFVNSEGRYMGYQVTGHDGMRERSKKPKWKGFSQRKKERKTFLTKVLGWNKEVI